MATLSIGTARAATITPLTGLSGFAKDTSGFLFYSDQPEPITSNGIADNGFYLNKVSNLSGKGQIYTWHHNKAGKTINHCILLYNPDPSKTVTVSVLRSGLTLNTGGVDSDTTGWTAYFNGNGSSSVTIGPKTYKPIFLRSIPAEATFRVIAEVIFSNTGSTGLTVWDLAYVSNSGGGINPAPTIKDQQRGKAAGYNNTISVTLSPTDANGVAFSFGGGSDSFSDTDIRMVTSEAGGGGGRLIGNYGMPHQVKLTLKNNTPTNRNYKIFIGSKGGYSFPLVKLGSSVGTKTWIPANNYVDMIAETVLANSSKEVVFYTCVPAVASTPYLIGARIA